VPARDELPERGLGTVGRRREAVGAQPDPREHRDERDRVEGVLGPNVFGRTKEESAQSRPHGGLGYFAEKEDAAATIATTATAAHTVASAPKTSPCRIVWATTPR